MGKTVSIIYIVLRVFLGGMMVFAGASKLINPAATTAEVVSKIKEISLSEHHIEKTIFIDGLQQSGYFFQFLGACELVFGILLVIQITGLLGALLMLPITLNIFLFHLFLEADEVGELVFTAVLLLVNIALVLKEKEKVKGLVTIKPL